MPRYISLYEKTGNNLVNRMNLMRDDHEFFQALFGNPIDDPLVYDSYRIDEEINLKIFHKMSVMVDIVTYDCYVEFAA